MVTILPVFRYWTVVLDANDVVVPNTADPVDIGVDTEPVGIGSSVPTWMRAGRLSVASTVGEERTLTRESAIRALMKTRRSLVPMMPLIPLPNCPAVVVGGKIPLRIAPPEPNACPKIAGLFLLRISYSIPKD